MMSEHHEDEEHAQVGGGHGEEIDRDEITDMVGQVTYMVRVTMKPMTTTMAGTPAGE
jgi:hypothetical protein